MNRIAYRLLIFVLVFSPLAFGAVEQWSRGIMETLSLLSLCLFLYERSTRQEDTVRDMPGIVPLASLLVYMFFQFVPLPAAVVGLISPGTAALYRNTAGIDDPVVWMSLSVNKKATVMEFMRMLSYAALYIVSVQLLMSKDRQKKTVGVIAIFASVLAVFAVVQHFLPNGRIYWFRELTQGGLPFGPYVNRNHYAGLMGMIFPVVLSTFLFYKPHVGYGSFRERVAGTFNQKMTNTHILLGFSAVLIALSVFVSLSRGGIVSLSSAMIFFGTLLLFRGGRKKRGLTIITIFFIIWIAVGWIGWEPLFERFERIVDVQGRITEPRITRWNDSMKIVRDFPLWGTGFGTYMNIYPRYRTIPGTITTEHAHNDYLELLTDGGVLSFFLMSWFLIAVFFRSFRVFSRRRSLWSVYLFIGSATGMLSVLIHSITDFNLHIGANGLYFFFLAGLAVSASHAGTDEKSGSYLERLRGKPARKLFVASLVLLLVTSVFNAAALMGQLSASSVKKNMLTEGLQRQELDAFKRSALRAAYFDPLEGEYRYILARISQFLSEDDDAIGYYRKAVMLDPLNSEYLQMYGLALSTRDRDDEAERYLKAGIDFDGQNLERYRRYALWLFSRNRTDEGIGMLRRAIAMEPRRTKDYITMMVLNGLDDSEIQSALPDMSEPHVRYAEYLAAVGSARLAGEVYLRAFSLAENENMTEPGVLLRIFSYFREAGRSDVALLVMQKAVERYPHNIGIIINAAQAYEDAGLTFRAIGHYRRALVIDPRNRTAQNRLNALLKER